MDNDLTKKPIPGLIRKIAIPATVGFFFSTMYNVVDTYYGGLVSTEALAALGLSFPIFFVIIAIGSGLGTGATALISNAIGAKKTKETKLFTVQAISFTVLMSIILTFVGLLLAPFLFRLLGATDQYLNLSLSYMNIIFYGTVFFMFTFTLNSILNAHGDTKTYRNFLIVGFFLNLILNPALMFGWVGLPKLGFNGIAWATFLIQVIGTIYMGYKVGQTGIFCKKCMKMFIPQKRPFMEIAKQGFPASLNMMTVALGIFIITYFISQFGKEAIAAYGIATRIEQIVLLPMIGINIATLAMVGQNNGAKKFGRIKLIIKTAIKYGIYVAIAASAILLITGRWLLNFFTDDTAVIDIGVKYLLIAAFITWTYVIMYLIVSALQGLKRPMFAVWIGLYRQILAPVVIFFILVNIFALGLYGIWYGILAINWSAAIITIIYARYAIKKALLT